MKCPACERELREMTVDKLTVDVCEGGCGGIWFDPFELKQVDEAHECAGEALLEIDRDQNLEVDHSQRRKCPRCDDMILMRHFFSANMSVEVDECPGCGGMWLDEGELSAIRDEYTTEADRKTAATAHFDQIFNVELQAMKAEREFKQAQAQKIYNIFRFICPSHYLKKRT